MSVRVSVCLSVRMCYIICKLPVLLQLSENMSSSVIIVAIQRAGLPDNSVSILGWRGSLSCTPECFGPTACLSSISSVGTVYICPGVKRPKCSADHCCLVPKLREGRSMLPLSHMSSWCTEERYYFDGMKFVLQKWWIIIVRSILSSNRVSCHMIMFHVLTTCSCYFHFIMSSSNS